MGLILVQFVPDKILNHKQQKIIIICTGKEEARKGTRMEETCKSSKTISVQQKIRGGK